MPAALQLRLSAARAHVIVGIGLMVGILGCSPVKVEDTPDGGADGASDGAADGTADGASDGAADGSSDGAADGAADGAVDGGGGDGGSAGGDLSACSGGGAATDVSGLSVVDGVLAGDVGYSGGCEEHFFTVCWPAGDFSGSPPTAALELLHEGIPDPCEAYAFETLRVDLAPLRARYLEATGGAGGPAQITLAGLSVSLTVESE
jgi:hypothetical protein